MAKVGVWNTPSDRILPGVYSRFLKVASSYGEGLVGTIGIPVRSNWGPVGEVVTVKNSILDLKEKFGDDEASKFTAYRLGKLLVNTNLKYIKMYRVADSSAAKSSINLKNTNGAATDIIKLTSKYPTSKDLNVTVKKSVAPEKTVEMYIYEGTKLLCRIYGIKGTVDEMVKVINTTYVNKYIVAEKLAESTDILAEVSNKKLVGGNDGCSGITNKEYIASLKAFERERIDGFVLDAREDESLDVTVFEWIKENYSNGRTIMYFSGARTGEDIYATCDRAKKVNNKLYSITASSGVMDNVKYTPLETAVYLCGLEISNKLKESSCNRVTIFNSVGTMFTNAELEEAHKSGVITLDIDGDDVVIVDDVNTYKIYEDDNENETVYGFNRTIRTVSAINDMLVTSGKPLIGKVNSDEIGYDIIITAFKKGFEYLIASGALKEFSIAIDQERQEKAKSDEFFFVWDAIRLDKVKRMYGTGTLR